MRPTSLAAASLLRPFSGSVGMRNNSAPPLSPVVYSGERSTASSTISPSGSLTVSARRWSISRNRRRTTSSRTMWWCTKNRSSALLSGSPSGIGAWPGCKPGQASRRPRQAKTIAAGSEFQARSAELSAPALPSSDQVARPIRGCATRAIACVVLLLRTPGSSQ